MDLEEEYLFLFATNPFHKEMLRQFQSILKLERLELLTVLHISSQRRMTQRQVPRMCVHTLHSVLAWGLRAHMLTSIRSKEALAFKLLFGMFSSSRPSSLSEPINDRIERRDPGPCLLGTGGNVGDHVYADIVHSFQGSMF